MSHLKWHYCAREGCERITSMTYCKECAAMMKPTPSGLNAALIRAFLQQPEITDPAGTERALMRVIRKL